MNIKIREVNERNKVRKKKERKKERNKGRKKERLTRTFLNTVKQVGPHFSAIVGCPKSYLKNTFKKKF